MTGVFVILGAVATSWLWMGVIAPSIGRLFGVPLAYGLWRIDWNNQSLTRLQYVWGWGVLGWGVGMFLFFTTWDLLELKMLNHQLSSDALRPEHIALTLLTTALFGVLFGVWTAPHKRAERP